VRVTPLSTFIRVDLPAPFSPQIAWMSPRFTVRLTSLSAFTPGNSLVIERISRIGWLIGAFSLRRGAGGAGVVRGCPGGTVA
jgi:hypothetical protein